jgi:hypothetical protein
MALRLPAFFFVGGIDPNNPDNAKAMKAEFVESLNQTDGNHVIDSFAVRPFLPSQATQIRDLLTASAKDRAVSQQAIDESFERIRLAAQSAQDRLQQDYEDWGPPRFQLMTELKRVANRGRLSKSPDPSVVDALLYGVTAADILDVPVVARAFDGSAHPLEPLVRGLTASQLRQAAETARSREQMLYGIPGQPAQLIREAYIADVVREFCTLTEKKGAPFYRVGSIPSGALIVLLAECLRPIDPEISREAIANCLRKLRTA